MGLEEEVAALTARVVELERRLAAAPPPPSTSPSVTPPLTPFGAPSPPPVMPKYVSGMPPPPGPQSPQAMAPPPFGGGTPTTVSSRPDWFTTETLLQWAGLLLVVLAAIFFVANAISRGWIGPEVQLLGATIIGLALLAGAVWLAPERRSWAIALGCGGAVVLPICAAAANAELDLVGPYPALVAVALVLAAVVAVAWRLSMEAVAAVVGVFAGFAMLWVADIGDLPPLVPGGWLVVTALAATAVGWLRSWTTARVVIVALSGFELLLLLVDGPDLSSGQRAVAVVGTIAVGIAALAGPVIAGRTAIDTGGWRSSLDRRFVVVVPLWTWATASAAVVFTSTTAFVLAGLMGAALTAALAVAIWQYIDHPLSAAYVSATATLLLAAVIAGGDGPVALVVLAATAAAGVVLGRWLDDLVGLVYSLCLGVAAVMWTAGLLLGGLIDPLPWSTLAAAVVVVGVVALGAFAVERWGHASQSVPLLVTAWAGALGWTAAAFVHGPQGQVVVSLIWAAAAIGVLMVGVTTDRALFRGIGLVTLGLVLAKLLTVDLASVDPLWRVGLFLVVGAGLMRLGYVLPKLSARAKAPLA